MYSIKLTSMRNVKDLRDRDFWLRPRRRRWWHKTITARQKNRSWSPDFVAVRCLAILHDSVQAICTFRASPARCLQEGRLQTAIQLAGPIATVIAALTAGGIAIWLGRAQVTTARLQAKTANDKIVLDLFDRRLKIYSDARAVIGRTTGSGQSGGRASGRKGEAEVTGEGCEIRGGREEEERTAGGQGSGEEEGKRG